MKRKVLFTTLVICGFAICTFADSLPIGKRVDAPKTQSVSEYSGVYKFKRVSSTFPVEVKTKGFSLQVTSKHSQVLPIYKENGAFYGLFLLNKGVNWISGLPKGSYIINNVKFELS